MYFSLTFGSISAYHLCHLSHGKNTGIKMELKITKLEDTDKNPQDVLNWFLELCEQDLVWNINESPKEALHLSHLTDNEIEAIESNVAIVFHISKEHMFCPFSMLVDVCNSGNNGRELNLNMFLPTT